MFFNFKKEYSINNLILFSREHDNIVKSLTNAQAYFKYKGNYCFIATLDKSTNKVKDVFTNKCFDFDNGYVKINGVKYIGLSLATDIKFIQEDTLFPFYILKINPKFNKCDIFLANKIQLDRTMDEQLIESDKCFSKFFIRKFLNHVNESIHTTYQALIKLNKIDYGKEK